MDQRVTARIPISSIILDEDIYPRKGIDHRRVGMFAENIREGFLFDPVQVEALPDRPGAGWTIVRFYATSESLLLCRITSLYEHESATLQR